MKKLNLLLLALLCSVGLAWAEATTATFDFQATESGLTVTSGSGATVSYAAACGNASDNNCLTASFGSTKGTKTQITTNVSYADISNIKFMIAASDRGKTDIKIELSSTADFSSGVQTIVAEQLLNAEIGGATITSNNTFVNANVTVVNKSGYIRITVGQVTSSNNKVVYLDKLQIIYNNPQTVVDVTDISLDNSSLELEAGAKATLTATISPANATNKNITWESDHPEFATVDNKGNVTAVTAGSAVISATTEDGNFVANCTVTVIPAATCLDINADATEVSALKPNILSHGYLSSTDNWNGDYFNMSSSDRNLTITVSGATAFEVFVKNSTAGRNYKVKVADGEAVTVTHPGRIASSDVISSGVFYTGTTDEVTITLLGNGNSVYPDHFTFYTETIVARPGATLNTEGYATYSCESNVEITGATVYKASVEGTTVTLTPIAENKVPANTGVILSGTPGATVTASALAIAPTIVTDNDLLATSNTNKPSNGFTYVLNGNAFKNYTGSTLAANKAYLHFDTNPISASAPLSIVFADEVTGVEDVIAAELDWTKPVFNILGQQVAEGTTGILIQNGVKFILK